MVRTARIRAAVTARTPTPASTRIGDIVLLALLAAAVVLGRDGDGAVLDRTEGPGSDVVAASGQVGEDAHPCGGGVDFGAHFRPAAGRRESVYSRVARSRQLRIGFQVIRQPAEPVNKLGSFGRIGVGHRASPLRIDAGISR